MRIRIQPLPGGLRSQKWRDQCLSTAVGAWLCFGIQLLSGHVRSQAMKVLSGLLVLAGVLGASPVLAQGGYPYSCEWVSEITPEAVIRFTSTNGTGTHYGNLFYRGQRLMSFQEGQSMGYGSYWWSTGQEDDRLEQVIVFRGNQVVRGAPGGTPSGHQRVLVVGLGSSLWYGQNPQWREMTTLLIAAEGFWKTSDGCRDL